jgi:hypothetical protein
MNKEELKHKIDELLNISADLYNKFIELPDGVKHKMDDAELCRDIHDIQNRVMSIAYQNNIHKSSKSLETSNDVMLVKMKTPLGGLWEEKKR